MNVPTEAALDTRQKRLLSVVLLVAAACLVIAALTVDVGPGRDQDVPTDTVADNSPNVRVPKIEGPIGEKKPGYLNVGGVYRPASDVRLGKDRPGKRDDMGNDVPNPGFSPAVKPDANPQVASVAKALKEKKNPARYSSFVKPAKFDAKAYASDPQSHLNVVEPGRVFQPAQPSPDVKRLNAVSGRYHRVTQGESVTLAVKGESNGPVTFTSFNLGSFENQLTSITVQADEAGLAQAPFTATPGTIDDIRILAASPLNSGQAQFTVNVALPKKAVAANP